MSLNAMRWKRCSANFSAFQVRGSEIRNMRKSRQPTQRQLRVGEALRHALVDVLAKGGLRDPALRDKSITVSEVRISPDLKNARAFVMPLGGREAEDFIAALRRAAPGHPRHVSDDGAAPQPRGAGDVGAPGGAGAERRHAQQGSRACAKFIRVLFFREIKIVTRLIWGAAGWPGDETDFYFSGPPNSC